MSDIFLSYASADRERVRPLVERLEKHGWSVWWDREIPPGQTWPQMIEGALAATKAMVVVWSEASVKSKWVQIETTKGEQRGGLIPVAIDPVEAPLQFSLIQAADLTEWDHSPDDRQVRKVIEQLERILGIPVPETTSPVEATSAQAAADPMEIERPQRVVRSSEAVTLLGHTDTVGDAAFSPDGSLILTTALDGTARMWNAADGRAIWEVAGGLDQDIYAEFSPDGSRIITQALGVNLWNAADGNEVAAEWTGGDISTSAEFSPDGSRVLTCQDDYKQVRMWLWNAVDGSAVVELGVDPDSISLAARAFSPDGSRIGTGSKDGTARVWNATDGRAVAQLTGHTGWVHLVAFSPDGSRFLTGSVDGTAAVWNTATGNRVSAMIAGDSELRSAAFSPDGSLILTTALDGTARMWNAADGRAIWEVAGGLDQDIYAEFSPDGLRILTESADRTVRLWNAADGTEVAELTKSR